MLTLGRVQWPARVRVRKAERVGASSPLGTGEDVPAPQKTCEGTWPALHEVGRRRQTVGRVVGLCDVHLLQVQCDAPGLEGTRGVGDGVTRAQAELVDAA